MSGLQATAESVSLLEPLAPYPRKEIEADGRSIVIYQVFYDPASKLLLQPEYNPYFNRRLTRYVENSVITDLIESGRHIDCDFFGVFSWRFHLKIPVGPSEILGAMKKDGFSSDVYSFFDSQKIQSPQIWNQTDYFHPGALKIARRIFEYLELRLAPEEVHSTKIYENHFLCRPELYQRYYEELLKPCMDLMENGADPELSELLMQDANYRRRSALALTDDEKISIFGRPYFTFHPFICERLFSTWLHLNPSVKVSQIASPKQT